MAEPEDDAAEAVQRLQAALERIAELAQAGAHARGFGGGDPVPAELAVRLDALIAQLRAALRTAPEAKTSR